MPWQIAAKLHDYLQWIWELAVEHRHNIVDPVPRPHFSHSLSEKCSLGITHPQTTLFTEWAWKIWSRLCSTATAYHIPRPYFSLGGCETCGLPHMRLATIPIFVVAMPIHTCTRCENVHKICSAAIHNKTQKFCVDKFVDCEMKWNDCL